ncbi:MAG TPA: hypothetical protein VG167_06260 [Verrucomicrobiae bacterium]|nr:hypothetical protein [Verrucomicrobiae bacterium]
MKALLLCPPEQTETKILAANAPLAAVPMLGASLVEYWLSHLALTGVSHVRVLAHDRPEHICALAADGARWGLSVEVTAEPRELTASQAMVKYASELGSTADPAKLVVLDHLPGMSEQPLFSSYAEWFNGLRAWMPRALTPDRVGVRELRPGVWVGIHSRISPDACLIAPSWVGERVFVGAHAVIGPHAIIESGAFIEPGVEITESWVAPDTFVGQLARIARSLAAGNQLVHWPTATATTILDPFLMCRLRHPRRLRGPGWLTRAADVYSRNKEDVACLWKQLLLHKEG